MTLPAFPGFQPDEEWSASIDDLCWRDIAILRIERMDKGCYWLWVQMADGQERHIDIALTRHPRRTIFASVRE